MIPALLGLGAWVAKGAVLLAIPRLVKALTSSSSPPPSVPCPSRTPLATACVPLPQVSEPETRLARVFSVDDQGCIIITYDALGFPRTVQSAPATPGATPAVTTFTRDTLGRPIQVRDPLGRVVKVRFDERNHPVETTLPAISANGAQESLPPAKARQVFDVNDLLRESIAVDGARTVYTYDEAHKLESVKTPGNPVPTLLDYDAMENMVKMTNSNGQATTYAFDRLNRNTAMTYPGGDGETYQFDANSNLVAWNRGSYVVQYTFDDLDRLSRLDSPTTNDHIALTYDQLDRVATMTDNSGTTTYGYTNNYLLDRVTRDSGVVSYGYDAADRLTTLTADGDVTQYSYDDRDRLVQATLDGQSVNYAFDQADRPTLMSFSNGVSCQQVFNERDGLLSKRYLRGGSPLFSVKYAYNQLGQRKLEEKKTSNWTKSTRYAYNKRRELSNSYRKVNNGCTIETSYGFDLNHNRIKKNETRYSSNANDQLTTVQRPSQTLAYNAAGQAKEAGSSSFTYSYSDQIKTVNTGATQATYVYDGNGQRVQKTVDGVISRFLWAGSEIIKEYTGSGEVKAQYFLGGGRTAIKHNNKWNFYLTDGLGSTVMLADHRGRSVATWDYDDFGETTQLTGGTSVYNPFLYTGQELDKETGFYHLRARHYAPSLGKFLSRDPIGYGGGSNLYSYCGGDPINRVDPSGLEPIQVQIGPYKVNVNASPQPSFSGAARRNTRIELRKAHQKARTPGSTLDWSPSDEDIKDSDFKGNCAGYAAGTDRQVDTASLAKALQSLVNQGKIKVTSNPEGTNAGDLVIYNGKLDAKGNLTDFVHVGKISGYEPGRRPIVTDKLGTMPGHATHSVDALNLEPYKGMNYQYYHIVPK